MLQSPIYRAFSVLVVVPALCFDEIPDEGDCPVVLIKRFLAFELASKTVLFSGYKK
ncbi:hypothetical protein NOR51B_1443 [Luminiphilus syltensis NOR5-1B]|uniref:Uncharacterized protein n=1 Tax=Luminiphilus syltensis NOR5-1B TaxID=565045 RepID=B8KTZ2_9GAMM|nr:hypothetical protein NOR51B_1443 [Luminiphilus syltensis NOR5-1B]